MSVELHLPDLPEVPISLGGAGPAPRRRRAPWHLRLRDMLSSYLPLLLMLALALATWWLAKNSPQAAGPAGETPLRTEPDYTMTGFALERFDANGRLKLRLEGALMHHYPATDRIEIEDVQIRAIAPDGRITLAHAKRALANGDASEVQLMGGAEVTSDDAQGMPLVMRGEFLHAFLVTEKLKSHLPVQVLYGSTEVRGAGLDYDHATRRLDLVGPTRATLMPRPR
ncbi:MAG: LPS export ABC transporter periplasmic protein LptC [Chitinophagaceae bacterium]|nr:LPS export ABC transporter periplasmic protein LptC [Rubrivivax sp.]